VFGHYLQCEPVRAVDTRVECRWSHTCKSFKRAGVGTNGILECKFLSKNAHRTATAVFASSRYAKAGKPRRLTGQGHVSHVSTQLYIRLAFSASVRAPTRASTRVSMERGMLQYGRALAVGVRQPW
jgi:hypothetical protein